MEFLSLVFTPTLGITIGDSGPCCGHVGSFLLNTNFDFKKELICLSFEPDVESEGCK